MTIYTLVISERRMYLADSDADICIHIDCDNIYTIYDRVKNMCHVLCCWTPCHSSTCCVLLSLPQIGNIIKLGYRCRIGYNWQWWSSFRPVWSGVNFFLLLQLFLFSTKTLAMPIFLHQTKLVLPIFLASLHVCTSNQTGL